eukprot:COSAG02_NODE_1360_length_13055_cov_9.008567_12_plen_88_part_00
MYTHKKGGARVALGTPPWRYLASGGPVTLCSARNGARGGHIADQPLLLTFKYNVRVNSTSTSKLCVNSHSALGLPIQYNEAVLADFF